MSKSLGLSTINIPAIRDIFATDFPAQQITEIPIKVHSTSIYKRGTCLAKITATGKYTIWDNTDTATDGSEILVGILANDVDSSVTEDKAVVYISGDFVAESLIAIDPVAVGNYNNLGPINIISETP